MCPFRKLRTVETVISRATHYVMHLQSVHLVKLRTVETVISRATQYVMHLQSVHLVKLRTVETVISRATHYVMHLQSEQTYLKWVANAMFGKYHQ